jgi:hypothetical protein
VNSFVPTASVGSVGYGSSVTILGRPQTPGAGVVPTGSYAFYDSVNNNQVCSATTSGCTLLSASNAALDASGEAYLTTSTLAQGMHYITMVYGGDSNFTSSTTATPYVINVVASVVSTSTSLSITTPTSIYGGTITGTVTVTPASGSDYAVGTVTLYSGSTTLGTCALNGTSSTCSFSLTGSAAGAQAMIASYSGGASTDGNENFSSSSSGGAAFAVNQAVLQVTANNAFVAMGGAMQLHRHRLCEFGYLRRVERSAHHQHHGHLNFRHWRISDYHHDRHAGGQQLHLYLHRRLSLCDGNRSGYCCGYRRQPHRYRTILPGSLSAAYRGDHDR